MSSRSEVLLITMMQLIRSWYIEADIEASPESAYRRCAAVLVSGLD